MVYSKSSVNSLGNSKEQSFEQEFELNNVDMAELGLEVLEVDESTVLEEMGASFGTNSCSIVIAL